MDSEAAWKRYKGDRWKFTVSSENTVRKKYVKNKWKRIDGKYFYFDSKGWLKTGRIKVKKKWYYCDYEKGRISNQWVGDYYYGKNGVMVRNQWVGMYYVGKNGKKFLEKFGIQKMYGCCLQSLIWKQGISPMKENWLWRM